MHGRTQTEREFGQFVDPPGHGLIVRCARVILRRGGRQASKLCKPWKRSSIGPQPEGAQAIAARARMRHGVITKRFSRGDSSTPSGAPGLNVRSAIL